MAVDGGPSSGGYGPASAGPAPGGFRGLPDYSLNGEAGEYWPHIKMKRAFTDFVGSKRNELAEQQQARRYRHGAQWSAEQISTFNKRRQPVVTYNRLSRKIDVIIGWSEKMMADPKAYPNSPRHQQGADLATAALRAALEGEKWKQKTPFIAEQGAVDGYGGIELVLEQGKNGYEIRLEPVDNEGFFYDPRSKKKDFSDASYMGMGKWVDLDVAIDLMPDKKEQLKNAVGDGADLTTNSDGDAIWFMPSGDRKSVRLVYICYRHAGGWCWCLFTGSDKLMEGKSYFNDKEGRPICSFIMYSMQVDHDYDRYGFPRPLKSPQDEINQRRSKGLHELQTRRIIAEKGAFDDIEKARQEAVRPDGIVERNKGYEAEFDDARKAADVAGQVKFMEDAKLEFENFGPNPSLFGSEGINNRSGRAISLMQQAGIAELGPFTIEFRNWKLRVYEAVFNAIKKYWTNERWIRLTDAQGMQQLVQLNAMQIGPMGVPIIVNAIGQLDVDIILDEGPDVVTQQQDLYETLQQIVPGLAPMMTPPQVQVLLQGLVQLSPMPVELKQQFAQVTAAANQPNPLQQKVQQLQVAGAEAEVQKTQSETMLNMAKAQNEGMPDQMQPQEFELPPIVQVEQAMADIDKMRADAAHKRSLAGAEQTFARIAPFDYAQKAFDAAADRGLERRQQMFDRMYDVADLSLRKYEADAARQQRKTNGAAGK